MTTYNQRPYRIRQVRFDKSPVHPFEVFSRETGTRKSMTYAEYANVYYGVQVSVEKPAGMFEIPLLEAYEERPGEEVLLVPGVCAVASLRCRPPRGKEPPEGHLLLECGADAEAQRNDLRARAMDLVPEDRPGAGFSVGEAVEARAVELEPLVAFTTGDQTVPAVCFEDALLSGALGGLVTRMRLTNWVLIHGPDIASRVPSFVGALQKLAALGSCEMCMPWTVQLADVHGDLPQALFEHVTGATQLVLLIVPERDSHRVYPTFKRLTLGELPVASQAVLDTTLKDLTNRGAAALSRLLLQINAKVCGPCWHVGPAEGTPWLAAAPTMCVGVEVCDGQVALSASLNPRASLYFTRADGATGIALAECLESLAAMAVRRFADANGGVLPERILVYRFARLRELGGLREVELPALRRGFAEGLAEVPVGTDAGAYEPTLGCLAVARVSSVRFFREDTAEDVNPQSGVAVESEVTFEGVPNFYLVPHVPVRGCGVTRPAHYVVVENPGMWSSSDLQNTTHLLSHLNFNCPAATRFPAPLAYARRAAALRAVTRIPVHRRLCEAFYML